MDLKKEIEFIRNFEKAYKKYVEEPMGDEIRKLILNIEFPTTSKNSIVLPKKFKEAVSSIAWTWGSETEKLFKTHLNKADEQVLRAFYNDLKNITPKRFKYKRTEFRWEDLKLLKRTSDNWKKAITLNSFASKWYTKKYYSDGLSLSDRVWKYSNEAAQKIQNTVALNLRIGNSAKNTAQQIRELNPQNIQIPKYLQKEIDQMSDKYLIDKVVNQYVNKKLNYNAMRVARTEINNAWKGSYKEKMDQLDFVGKVKWELSASHPERDICDTYAEQDLYGFGAGVYPKDNVPHDGKSAHPNCLCITTMVLEPIDEWVDEMYKKYVGG